ncbi:MAG TPA: hypothetical protein VFT87_02390 [Candidatus Saccharimonadales bacterium]|nr:hypothetical protein [Candidatus Saccharimonadales bacterium]
MIGAIPEEGDKPSAIFDKGFIVSPSTQHAVCYGLRRSIRIRLADFVPSSENRRILRKGADFSYKLVRREDFLFTQEWRNLCKQFAGERFGEGVMDDVRLARMFESPMTTHVMVFTGSTAGKGIGITLLYVEPNKAVYLFYSFYDLTYYARNLGMYQATSVVKYFADLGYEYCYLGTGYQRKSLYKTQFKGVQFFTGFRWSNNLDELKHLVEQDEGLQEEPAGPMHRPSYLGPFYPADKETLLAALEVTPEVVL